MLSVARGRVLVSPLFEERLENQKILAEMNRKKLTGKEIIGEK